MSITRKGTTMSISETAVKSVAHYLQDAGCESALIGSIWQHWEKGDEDGVLKATSWAWYVTMEAK